MKNIEHIGEIITIDGHMINVEMSVNSACVSCQAKSACGAAETTNKNVMVFVEEPQYYIVGESVLVEITQKMGFKAVMYAYILPFLLLFATLQIVLKLSSSEVIAGVTSLGIMFPYYATLYLMRNRLDREIIFNLRKL